MIERIDAGPRMSEACIHGDLVYLAGQVPETPGADIETQTREVLAAIDLDNIHANGYSFQIEMTHTAWHLGFRIVESPITFEERREGQSKMSGGIINEALWMVWKLLARCGFRRRPSAIHPQSVAAGPKAG